MDRQTPSTPMTGLTARELFAKSDRKIIQEIVKEQVKLIDAAINTAHSAGFSQIEQELPTNFNINNMSKSDAQTMIYSELIMIYKNPEEQGGKGFEDVSIDYTATKAFLHIKWLNGMDPAEKERRKRIIRDCMVQRVVPRGGNAKK